MTGNVSFISGSFLITICLSLPAPAAAQAPLFEVENGGAGKLLLVNPDGGFVVRGTLEAGAIPATGHGTRLMWYPRKAAFRAGYVDGQEWDDASIGRFSAAFGEGPTASGDHSLAFGGQSRSTLASGRMSIALGDGAKATAENTTAIGTAASAEAPASTAIGVQTRATGSYAAALGFRVVASGERASALGSDTEASGFAAATLGSGTKAGGFAATGMGTLTTANGVGSTAMGGRTIATGDYSTAMGFESRASGGGAVAMGSGSSASGDGSLAVGFQSQASGVSSLAVGSLANAVGTGSVALGTRAVAQGEGSFVFADRSSTTQPYTGGVNQFVVRAHGGIGLNSGTNIGCDLPAGVGSWACTSSRLAKEGFEDVDGEWVLSKLGDIRIQRWRYLGTPSPHVGPTAEDFRAAFGLGESSTKIATVDADGIALRAVQALERRTAASRLDHAALSDRVAGLEAELARSRAEVAELRSLVVELRSLIAARRAAVASGL